MFMWKKEETFFDSSDYFDSFIKDVASSKKSISIEMFILEDGSLWKKIRKALWEAHQRGVVVSMVVDGYGASVSKMFLYQNGFINFRFFKPLWTQVLFLKQRNHRKLLIIDDEIAYVGSSNIHDNTLHWRETGIRVQGDSVKMLKESFLNTWHRSKGSTFWEKIESKTDRLLLSFKKLTAKKIILTDSSFDRYKIKYFWLKKILKSKERIWISTPYFIPPTLIYVHLLKAAKRGIDVRIIVPAKNKIDFPWIKTIERYYIEKLIQNGAKVYEYLPTMLHSKISIFDNEVIVGSSNWNHRSRKLDLELDLIVTDKDCVSSIEEAYIRDIKNSHVLHKDNFHKLNFFQRSFYNMLMLVKHLC